MSKPLTNIFTFIRNYLWIVPLLVTGYFFTIGVMGFIKVQSLIDVAHSKGDPAWGLIGNMWDKVSYVWASLIPLPISRLLLLIRTEKIQNLQP